MIAAAAAAIARLSTPPPGRHCAAVDDLRSVSAAVGVAVALCAVEEGVARAPVDDPIQQVHQAMWRPEYPSIEIKPR
jgi:malate dehydrogenase (oxaloacetate-decarboxylating)